MVVIDATNLLLMLRPGTPVPAGPDGVTIDRPKERIEFLIQQLDKAGTKVIIPTPALSEALVRAGAQATQKIIADLQKYSVFRIEPFDTRAAIEVAAMTREALDGGRKKGKAEGTWAKVKYDRQIVAIAKVNGATTIYSDDDHVGTLARRAKINVIKLADLPLPPEDRQMRLDLEVRPSANEVVKADGSADEEETKPDNPNWGQF